MATLFKVPVEGGERPGTEKCPGAPRGGGRGRSAVGVCMAVEHEGRGWLEEARSAPGKGRVGFSGGRGAESLEMAFLGQKSRG